MFCPNCGMENADTAVECRRCHVPLIDEEHPPEAAPAEAAHAHGEAAPADLSHDPHAAAHAAEQAASSSDDLGEVCRRCETYNPPGTSRCENCGYKLIADDAPDATAHAGSPSAEHEPSHEAPAYHEEVPAEAPAAEHAEVHADPGGEDRTPPTGFKRASFGDDDDDATRAEPPPNFDKTPAEAHPSLSDELSALAISDEDAREAFGDAPPADATPPDGVAPVAAHEPEPVPEPEPVRPTAKARPAAPAPVPTPPPPAPPAPAPAALAAPPPPPAPPAAAAPTEKLCSSCGIPNVPNAKFCAECGTPFPKVAAAPKPAPVAVATPPPPAPPAPPTPAPPVLAKAEPKHEEFSTDPSSGKVRSARDLDSTAEQPPVSLEQHLALSVAAEGADDAPAAEPHAEALHEEAHGHAVHEEPAAEAPVEAAPEELPAEVPADEPVEAAVETAAEVAAEAPAEEAPAEAAPVEEAPVEAPQEWADADAEVVAEAAPEALPSDATPPQGEPPLAEEALASAHAPLPDEAQPGFTTGEEPTNVDVPSEPAPTDEVLAAEPEPEPAPEPEPPYQVTVVVEKGSSAGTAFMLGRLVNAIGSTGAAIEIPEDPHLAPAHASLVFDDQRLLLRDEGAANGVYLKLKEATPLAPGDLFIAGERLLRFDGPVEIPLADETDTPFHGAPRPAAPAVRVTEVLFGGKTGRTCHRSGPVIAVGKTGCDLNFPADTLLAARHAEIHLAEDGSASLLDVGGVGTLLRVRPQATHELLAGDVLQVGDQVLRIEVG
jgi:ribosomal protein L40E